MFQVLQTNLERYRKKSHRQLEFNSSELKINKEEQKEQQETALKIKTTLEVRK